MSRSISFRRGVLILLVLTAINLAFAGDWPLRQRDSENSGATSASISPPLRRAWVARPVGAESFTTWPVVSGNLVVAVSGPGLIGVDAGTGNRRWYHKGDGGAIQVAPAIGPDKTFVVAPFGRLMAFEVDHGDELWRYQASGDLDSTAILADELVFVSAAESHDVLAVRQEDGQLAWSTKLEFEPDTTPAISAGSLIINQQDLHSPKGLVTSLDSTTGKLNWTVTQTIGYSSPSILGDKVIFGGGDFFAYALDLKTGRRIWRSPVESRFGVWNLPALAFGDVFLADRVGNIYRLDGETGRRKWKLDLEGTMDQSAPIIAGKTLYVGNGSGMLYGVDVDSGRLIWQEHIGGHILTGAADSERIYFGVKFGNQGLYAYEHDPTRKLRPPLAPLSPTGAMVGGLVLFAILVGAVILIARRTRRTG